MIVGSSGWKFEPILAAMRDLTVRGELVHLESVPAEEMRAVLAGRGVGLSIEL